MTATSADVAPTGAGWRKFAALLLGVAAVGLPVNSVADYALLLVLAVVIFSGEVRAQGRAWLAAAAIVAVAIAGQALLAPPRIEEGHNVFLPSPALERGLPADVYRHLAQEFDAQYPAAQRCDPKKFGCWRNNGFPDAAFAFSADSVWHKAAMSRAVTALDFSDPVWLRLGFINEARYNWTAETDVKRAERDRRFWMGLQRWHLTMPWFEMIRLPAAYVGGELCWRGDVMWESAGEHFALWRGDSCRTIASPMPAARCRHAIARYARHAQRRHGRCGCSSPAERWCWRRRSTDREPGAHQGAPHDPAVRADRPAVAVIAVDDGSFLGGVRPFDGGDDGCSTTRPAILQKLLAGDIWGGLEGERKALLRRPRPALFPRARTPSVRRGYLGYLAHSAVAVPGPPAVPPLPPEPQPLALICCSSRSRSAAVRHQLRALRQMGGAACRSGGLYPVHRRSGDGYRRQCGRPSGKFFPRCSARCCWRSVSP